MTMRFTACTFCARRIAGHTRNLTRKRFHVPSIVQEYNLYMNAMDSYDQQRSTYSLTKKGLRYRWVSSHLSWMQPYWITCRCSRWRPRRGTLSHLMLHIKRALHELVAFRNLFGNKLRRRSVMWVYIPCGRIWRTKSTMETRLMGAKSVLNYEGKKPNADICVHI